MNRTHRTNLRTALVGTLALAALTAGGINSGLAPHSTLSPDAWKAPVVASTLSPDAYKVPVLVGTSFGPALSYGPVADLNPDTSFGPALSYGPVADLNPDTSFGPVALQRNGGVADDRPVADVCPDSTLSPAGRLLASL